MIWFYILETRKTPPPPANLFELIKTVNKLTGYKANALKSVPFLYFNDKHTEKDQENHPMGACMCTYVYAHKTWNKLNQINERLLL